MTPDTKDFYSCLLCVSSAIKISLLTDNCPVKLMLPQPQCPHCEKLKAENSDLKQKLRDLEEREHVLRQASSRYRGAEI